MAKILKHLVFGQKKNPPVPPRPDYEGNQTNNPRFSGPIYCNIPHSGNQQTVHFEQRNENRSWAVTGLTTGDPSIQQYSSLVGDLEKQELEADEGIASPQVYGKLLAIYLLLDDMPNAKFLWKRIPAAVKEVNGELGKMWILGKKLWNRDFAGVFLHLDDDWPEHVKPILAAFREATRSRALQLTARAYSSFNVKDFSALFEVAANDTTEVMTSPGWEMHTSCEAVASCKSREGVPEIRRSSEERLSKLRYFANYLERK